MIVVGCRGLGAIGRRLLGSVSWGVVHHAHCPVAVIHDEDPLMPTPAMAPVVVGIDGSPASEAATAIAFEEASRRGVELVAVHAWSDYAVSELPGVDVVGPAEAGRRGVGRAVGGMAGALSRRDRPTCRRPGPAGASAAGAVGVCPVDGCRQPWSWRIRRDVARFGQFGGRGVGPHAGDRGPSVLTAYSSGRRWDWSSLEMNTAAWVRRSMPSLANNRDT